MTGDVAALAGGVGRQKVDGAGLVEADELCRAGIDEELLAVLLSMNETVEQGAGEAGGVGLRVWPLELLSWRQCSRSWDNVRPLGPADSDTLETRVGPALEVLDNVGVAEEDFDGSETGALTIFEGPAVAFELPLALAFEHELRLAILGAFANIEGEPGLLFSSTSRGRFRDSLPGDVGFEVEAWGLYMNGR